MHHKYKMYFETVDLQYRQNGSRGLLYQCEQPAHIIVDCVVLSMISCLPAPGSWATNKVIYSLMISLTPYRDIGDLWREVLPRGWMTRDKMIQ